VQAPSHSATTDKGRVLSKENNKQMVAHKEQTHHADGSHEPHIWLTATQTKRKKKEVMVLV